MVGEHARDLRLCCVGPCLVLPFKLLLTALYDYLLPAEWDSPPGNYKVGQPGSWKVEGGRVVQA